MNNAKRNIYKRLPKDEIPCNYYMASKKQYMIAEGRPSFHAEAIYDCEAQASSRLGILCIRDKILLVH